MAVSVPEHPKQGSTWVGEGNNAQMPILLARLCWGKAYKAGQAHFRPVPPERAYAK